MRTMLGLFYNRLVLVTSIAALLALATWGVLPRAASAQANQPLPSKAYSTGRFQLHDGEHVVIAILLPAIQRAQAAASFQLLNGQGMRLWTASPDSQNPGQNTPIYGSFFDITYRAPSANGGGIFECREAANDPIIVPSDDGVLVGRLLPAVQRNGKTSTPLGTSLQSFNPNGGTLTHANLQELDESVEPGF